MEVTRKGFISGMCATVVATALPSDRAFARTLAPQEPSGARSFTRLVGSVFYAQRPGGQRVPVVLREVVVRPGDPSIEQFSLVFAAGRRTTIPTGTCDVDHPSLGAFQLFLTGEGALARADFSLLRV